MHLIRPDPTHDGRHVDNNLWPSFLETTDDVVTIAEVTSLERGTITVWHPRALSFSTTKEPKKPAPPVTNTRLSFQWTY
jgi:hypothetical protein